MDKHLIIQNVAAFIAVVGLAYSLWNSTHGIKNDYGFYLIQFALIVFIINRVLKSRNNNK